MNLWGKIKALQNVSFKLWPAALNSLALFFTSCVYVAGDSKYQSFNELSLYPDM